MEFCPWCGREFLKIEDFFLLNIMNVEINDSEKAPEISKLLGENEPVKKYMSSIKKLEGKEVTRSKVLPNFKKDNVFKEFYRIPGIEDLYLSLEERETKSGKGRLTELSVYGKGPNIGSAGGPTLKKISQIGKINYEGLLRSRAF